MNGPSVEGSECSYVCKSDVCRYLVTFCIALRHSLHNIVLVSPDNGSKSVGVS